MVDIYTTNPGGVVIQRDLSSETEKIDRIVKKTDRVLFETSSVFPFDLFPDKLIIDENKINIVNRIFLFSEQVTPIFFKDLKSVTVSASILFATLTFQYLRSTRATPAIKYLWIPEAYKAKRITTGLIACQNETVDISKVPTSELLKKVEEIGRSRVEKFG